LLRRRLDNFKSGRTGRVLVSRERRESLLKEYDRSGMSGVKFAQYVGIKYSTLAYVWRCLGRETEVTEVLVSTDGGQTSTQANS
jgi:hypothetical protein